MRSSSDGLWMGLSVEVSSFGTLGSIITLERGRERER